MLGRFPRLFTNGATRVPFPKWSFQRIPLRFNASVSKANEKPSLKKLMQTYGYSALAVYLGLSALDFPICFFAVHSLGEETIKVYINKAKQVVGYGRNEQEMVQDIRAKIQENERKKASGELENVSRWERIKESTLLTEILIAYGIHKSLIVFRLPVTAAITPATVKLMQKWGFNLGRFNKNFKTTGESAKIKYKTGDPKDFVSGKQVPKQTQNNGKKWFDGMM
ncbi:LANO_0F05248g1_1 [Lachancea nothofagi CBS 11611]|uniref:LANO_0F05248g1_1 n=1 Tax=Lachancea nothofagi CBS 11611 TaxID=1266666 RepID=A0A1G4K832_9SACH|nr:LANO_0F05248g1_1 [Lachancea nothofagi CBS 11611]